MGKLKVSAVALGVLSVLSVVSCSSSSSDKNSSRGGGPTTVGGANGGAAVGANAAGGTPSSTGVDNGAMNVARAPVAGANGAAMQQPMMTPNTSISREPIALDDCGAMNPAGLSADDVQKLKAGSGSPGALRVLYPYDGTVFPRGMLAPDVMWDGVAADAVYIHIKSMIFEYWGCLKPTDTGRVTLSQDVWDNAGQRSFGKDDTYVMEVSVLGGGAVTGPAVANINIAQAAIKGSIYYNTYRSNLSGAATLPGGGAGALPGGFPGGGFGAGSNGIVVRIPAGGKAEMFTQTDCQGCHSVSADGSLLLAQSVGNGAMAYEISSGQMPMPTMAGSNGCWVGLYPDGSAALAMSTVVDVARAGIFGGVSGMSDATLFDTKTGQTIPSMGIPPGTLMPFFSPDGTFLVFNDYAISEAHGLALTNYDTKTHTASAYTMLFQEPAGSIRPAWPFVLPDNHGVVFVRTDDGDFTGGGVGVSGDIAPGTAVPFSELSVIDIASKQVTVLAKAMGFNTPDDAAAGKTYLPFGDEDIHHAFYPTVSPVGGGGYFWVFFDSVRHYGSLGLQRQLWGAALDISADGTYTRDPSHPPFYMSGQEFGTGNHRAFAALDPCRKDGDKCTSGVDCCGGFCYLESAAELTDPIGMCSPKMTMCARLEERCLSSADCCSPDPGQTLPNTCIAGFCTQVRGPD